MDQSELREIIDRKVGRYKDKLNIADMQLGILLEITNAINENLSTMEIMDKYKFFVQDQLKIERLLLFAKYRKWRVLLDYNVPDEILDNLDVEADLGHIKEITSVNSDDNEHFEIFDMIVPVFHGDDALAYLILGDEDDEQLAVSSIIKHLNFLQLLTNIVVSAIENQRLQQEALKQEKEKQKIIEKQNEMLEKQVAVRTKELRAEKDESERLLNNILPMEVADELKRKGSTTPQRYKEVSILFTDFKGFTATSATISPRVLVGELNDIFKAFDRIMDKHDVEKIKTIGDAYMAVCGIPKASDLHAIQCVKSGLDMIEFLEERGKRAKIKWEMRVGIHSGPLVAGVVGTRKFTYDVWGDTVNTAARMESNGAPAKINISARTHELIKDYFECEYRGKLEAKGKGAIDMHFVEQEIGSDGFHAVKKLVYEKLRKKLPKNLVYHGLPHTKDVVNAAENIAIREKVRGRDLELVKIAAIMHDSGFLSVYQGHEEVGAEWAAELLPKYGYNEEEIALVQGMIIATKIPQSPKNKFDNIICDSYLDYLGRNDF